MPHMIPANYRNSTNNSERRIFNALEGILDRPDWLVFHSLVIRQHTTKLMGEADFVVVVPGQGIVVVEAKSPQSVTYHDGEWDLPGTPAAHKNPFTQIDGATGSIRSFLLREGAIDGDEPFARLVWFTSLGRHHFDNQSPSHLDFFEWELAWADDLTRPAAAIERVLKETIAWFSKAKDVVYTPSSLTPSKCHTIEQSLRGDFTIERDSRDAFFERQVLEAQALAEQRFALDLVEANRAVYFDGPAGSGKSYLALQAALSAIKRGERTLVTCWNLAMAEQLREQVSTLRGPSSVCDLGSLMLRAAGLDEHPSSATRDWYEDTLPRLAIAGLATRPQLRGFRNIVVDEFQDIAASPRLLDFLLALAGPDVHFVLAGDAHQQIMQPESAYVDPYATLKALLPDLVLARIQRNCRHAPNLIHESEQILGHPFGFTSYLLPAHTPGGADQIAVTPDTSTHSLVSVLKLLTQQYGNADVVVLSPRGTHSLAQRALDEHTNANAADLRWLQANLGISPQHIRYGSISALKGIEVSAIVLTDVGQDSQRWAAEHGLSWNDLLYVALTRAKSHAVILREG